MSNINGNSLLMKEVNKNIIRNAIREELYATKQKLSEKTGLSIVTVGAVLQQFLEAGEIYEDKLVPSNGGRPAQRFCFNKNFSYILTICTYEENGKDKAVVSVRNLLGEEIDKKEEILNNPDLDIFEKMTGEFIEKYSQIKAIGFSMPGQEADKKIIIHDYKKLENVYFTDYYKEKFNLPVIFVNDVSAAVIGYCKKKENHNLTSVVYIYFPKKYPAGAGLYLDGKLYKGFNGTAGEIKYIPLGIDWDNIDYSSEDEITDVVSKLSVSVSAMFNPQKIVVYGEFFSEKILKKIEERNREVLKKIFIPEIVLSESFHQDFQQGATEITLDLLIPKLSLQE